MELDTLINKAFGVVKSFCSLFTTLHRYVVRSLSALPFLHRKGNKNIQYNRCIE